MKLFPVLVFSCVAVTVVFSAPPPSSFEQKSGQKSQESTPLESPQESSPRALKAKSKDNAGGISFDEFDSKLKEMMEHLRSRFEDIPVQMGKTRALVNEMFGKVPFVGDFMKKLDPTVV